MLEIFCLPGRLPNEVENHEGFFFFSSNCVSLESYCWQLLGPPSPRLAVSLPGSSPDLTEVQSQEGIDVERGQELWQ